MHAFEGLRVMRIVFTTLRRRALELLNLALGLVRDAFEGYAKCEKFITVDTESAKDGLCEGPRIQQERQRGRLACNRLKTGCRVWWHREALAQQQATSAMFERSLNRSLC